MPTFLEASYLSTKAETACRAGMGNPNPGASEYHNENLAEEKAYGHPDTLIKPSVTRHSIVTCLQVHPKRYNF